MIASIFHFELRYRFRQPLTWLILLMLAGQGIWYAVGIYDYYTGDEALINGAGIFYQCLAAGGMIMMAVVAMISGTTLYRDVAVGSANYIYACPMDEKRFFLTHFAAAYVINLLLLAAYPVGMTLVKYSGLGEPHLFGSTHWPQLLHGYLIFSVPNLFLLTSACFFGLVFARRMVAAYIGVVVLTLLFAVCEVMSSNAPYRFLLEVLDPFGYLYAKFTVNEMPVALKNSGFLPLTAAFWCNRLLWFSLALTGLFLSYHKFSFPWFIQLPTGKNEKISPSRTHAGTLASGDSLPIPQVRCSYGFRENLYKMLRLARTEFFSVVRPGTFKIIFVLLVVIVLMQDLFWNSTYYIGHQMPLTSGMCNVRLVNGFLFMVILMLLAGELFFKERTTGFWQIAGATPAPAWVLRLPKLFAMFGVAFLFALAIFLGGIFSQVLQGFGDIDLPLYLGDLFGYKFGWITYMFNIILVFFFASLFGNRYLTHILAIGYYLFMIISFDIGMIEQLRFGYALVPGVEDYSEMMGYGIWEKASFWLFLTWTSLAVFLALAAIQLWPRGVEQRTFHWRRLGWKNFFTGELSCKAKAAGVAALLLFFCLQSYIVGNSTRLRNYIPSDQADAEAALYERQYADAAGNNLLAREVHEVRIDLYPEERRAECAATVTLTNLSARPVERLYLNADAHTRIHTVTAGHLPLERLQKDTALGMWVYQLPEPLLPGKGLKLFVETRRQYRGFPQTSDEPQADLAANGLFFTEPIPFIGFDEEKTLRDNRDRKTHRLKKLTARLAAVDDADALKQGFISPWRLPGDGQKLNLTVSTTAPQHPFAPGKKIRSWQEENRNHTFFQIDQSTMPQPYVGSARYLTHDAVLEGVRVRLLHHPGHDYNLGEFVGAIEAGLAFINDQLGGYPYDELRVAEIPWHQEESYALANAVVLSEKEGWYADGDVPEMQGYIQYVLARDLIRQWLAARGVIADVQGADMLWTALPAALALQVVKERIGAEQVDALFIKMRKAYRRDRANEPIREKPLLFADEADYLEPNKGVIALYKLAGAVGAENFNSAVRSWVVESDGPLVFADLYALLKRSHALDSALYQLFETVQAQDNL